MKRFVQMTVVVMALAIAGCAEQGHYPGSGAACGPDDPVLKLDAHDCTVAPGL